MVDKISPEARSLNMKAIRSVNTKIEEVISKKLWQYGVRFRKNVKNLKGKPDIAIKKYKIVIFIDSCFWHSCPEHGHIPKSNTPFWIEKLERNRQRDEEVTTYYLNKGWNVLRIWEHEIKRDLEKTAQGVLEFIVTIKNLNHSKKDG